MAPRGEPDTAGAARVSWGGEHAPAPSDWHEAFAGSHLPWSVTVDDGGSGRHRCAARRLDDLVLVDCVCDPCRGVRAHREVESTDGEFVVLLAIGSGRETLRQGGEDLELRAGDVVTWDSAAPASFRVHARLAKRSLLVPKAVLNAGDRRTLTGAVRFDAASASVRLLVGYLDLLGRSGDAADATFAGGARNAALELLVASVRTGGVPDGDTTREALRAQMVRWIDDHLATAEITPAVLAGAHHVSERTVHRVFRASGETVGDVVRRRRLARARRDVLTSGSTLATIAHRWQFADLSHFTRSFKAAYGHPPSHLRPARVPVGR